ncbi:TPA: 4-(cytidine 5'-diphospho)-2-C-methyl-D-erythritol kinase, partial [Yersinia enterocolitica]|nr:4-(cytidine 5'-diphospho)-2-C-methyl-D-erythritol kinase [Yersinia enterocolitica]
LHGFVARGVNLSPLHRVRSGKMENSEHR